MVERSIEQDIRNNNFGARDGKYEKKRRCQESGNKTACTKNSWRLLAVGVQRAVFYSIGDNCSFRHDINEHGKVTPSNPSPNSFMQQDGRKTSRIRSPRGKSPSGRMFSMAFQGLLTHSFCEKVAPVRLLVCKSESGCSFGEKCSYARRQVDEQPCKRSKTQW